MLTVLGEAIVDLVADGGRRYTAHPGGSPLNVAVGLGRLGQPVSLAARLSHDAFGGMFREHLADSKVDFRHLVDAAQPSSLAVATVDESGVAAYDFWTDGTADWQWTDEELAGVVDGDTVALHTGSVALELEPGAARIKALLERLHTEDRVTISYDPNVRMAKSGPHDAGVAAVEAVVRLAHVVKVSSEDMEWIYPDEDPVEAGARWAGWGPGLVVVTMGGGGATALRDGREPVHVDSPPTDVVDTVGAGDAFSSGLLGALADRDALGGGKAGLADVDLPAVLARACLVASLTCARAGANPPARDEVEAAER